MEDKINMGGNREERRGSRKFLEFTFSLLSRKAFAETNLPHFTKEIIIHFHFCDGCCVSCSFHVLSQSHNFVSPLYILIHRGKSEEIHGKNVSELGQ